MGQRGQTLIETIVTTSIVAVFLSAMLSATIAAIAHFGPSPAHAALSAALAREMAVARNLEKYQGATLAPASIATTIPLPDGSPLPATMTLQATSLANAGLQLTITASALWNGSRESATLSSTLVPAAPIPGSLVALPGLAPAPTGAP